MVATSTPASGRLAGKRIQDRQANRGLYHRLDASEWGSRGSKPRYGRRLRDWLGLIPGKFDLIR
jgi:hypothetical protein